MGTSIKFRHERICREIVSLFPDNKNILVVDCGCGSGQLCFLLKEKGYKTIGIDVSKENVDYCQSCGIEAHISDICNLPTIENERFDITVCSEVLEHLDQDMCTKALGELDRITKKKGIVLITVPISEKESFRSAKHKRYVSSNELEEFFKNYDVIKKCSVLQREKDGKVGTELLFIIFRKD